MKQRKIDCRISWRCRVGGQGTKQRPASSNNNFCTINVATVLESSLPQWEVLGTYLKIRKHRSTSNSQTSFFLKSRLEGHKWGKLAVSAATKHVCACEGFECEMMFISQKDRFVDPSPSGGALKHPAKQIWRH